MSILLFFAVLFVLILVHEWGHYIVAKKTDMQVDEFGIGFPPKLYGKKWGETEYTLNALPIGGFVRILGEDAVGADATGARSRSFIAKSKWAQAAVLIAGVTMNILFAFVLFFIVYTTGVSTVVDEATAGPEARLVVTQVVPGGPADVAGLKAGVSIVEVTVGDATYTELTPSSFRTLSEGASEEGLQISYLLNDELAVTEVIPTQGVVATDPERLAIGVGLGMVEVVEKPLFTALTDAAYTTYTSLIAITVGLGGLVAGIFTGSADLSQVAGPIGIAGMVGNAASFGFASLLMFTAIISLNLAVINLLPFPALDGGRLLLVGIEAVTNRPINPVWVMRLNTVGFGLLMLLMIAVTYSDILKLF